jgi:hypothetical protein
MEPPACPHAVSKELWRTMLLFVWLPRWTQEEEEEHHNNNNNNNTTLF